MNLYISVTSTTAVAVISPHIQSKQACLLEERPRQQFFATERVRIPPQSSYL